MKLNTYRNRKVFIRKLIFWSVLIFGLLALFLVQTRGYAAEPIDICSGSNDFGCLTGVNKANYSGQNGVVKAVMNVVWFLVYIGTAISVLFIVLGAYRMLASNGDDSMFKKGRESVVNAVIGLVVAILAATIIYIVSSIVPGIDIFA